MAVFGLSEVGARSHSAEAFCPRPQTIGLTQMDAASHKVKARATSDPTGGIEVVFASVLYKKTIFRRLQGRTVDNLTGLARSLVSLSHTQSSGEVLPGGEVWLTSGHGMQVLIPPGEASGLYVPDGQAVHSCCRPFP